MSIQKTRGNGKLEGHAESGTGSGGQETPRHPVGEFTAKRAGVRSGKSESSVWDAVEMAELVVNSMVMFSFTHTLQGFWIWIKEAGRFAEGFP